MSKLPQYIGRYEVLELIGQGAMGKVYKARDPNIDRVVAIKVIRPELITQSETFLQRFRRETQAAGRLSHPNIVVVYDADMQGELSYMVMEYLEGRSLAQVLSEELSPQQIIDLSLQICDALDYAHNQGLVHRDIKPENVMILSTGRVKITDFGLARLATSPHLTHSGMITGTPSYMAPEQIAGEELDGRADIFALGCVMYEMIAGTRPFSGQSVGTVLYRVMNEEPEPSEKFTAVTPPMLRSIVLRMLAKRPEDRYPSCAEVLNDLKRCKMTGEALGIIEPLPPLETIQTAVFTPPSDLPGFNPFTYGNPITEPARFYGRHREIEQIFSRLRNPAFESSSIVGERRTGKTSLLRVIAHPDVVRANGLDPDKYIFVYNDLMMVSESTTPLQLWVRLLRTIRRQIENTDQELNDIIEELRASETVDNYLLADFFDLLNDIGIHVVLLLDEFENITYNQNFGPDFYGGLRSLAIHHNLALITSSRLELVNLCHSDQVRTSPFFNIFANINLRGLEPVAVGALLSQTANTPFGFTAEECQAIAHFAGNHPFFTQVAAHFGWDAYNEGLDENQRLDYMRHNAYIEVEPHLADYWQHSSEDERIVLTALALSSVLIQSSKRIDADIVQQSLRRIESVIGQLEKRTLVIARENQRQLFSDTFAEWILGELFDLVGAPDQEFQEWLKTQSSSFNPVVLDLLPRIKAKHRSWMGQWLSTSESTALLQAACQFVGLNGR
ncbi:MAG: serine/threonine-protein kinase PknK [Anaerolineae bacterium]|nr:serine/threonine-protein kinase PknK [Anaerolineae bacterium]